ncbi:MAG: hypothetical protein OEW58_05475 [Gammaproteobacteria bacterium]|nr:hypothetical protein [Gammaproteobacteria bacterium]
MFNSTLRLGFISLLLVTAVSGCNDGGGGGGPAPAVLGFSGTTTAAAIDSSNADTLGLAATEAVNFGITSNNNPLGSSGLVMKAKDSVGFIRQKAASAETAGQPKLAAQTIPGDCGGSATMNGDLTSGSIVYNNFCMDMDFGFTGTPDPILISGSISYFDDNATFQRMTFTNVTIIYQGETFTFSGGFEYDYVNMTTTEFSDFRGTDGTVYRVENADVIGDNATGYTVNARIYHPTHGYVDITTYPALKFNCAPAWQPSEGSITVADSLGNTVEVVFNSCTDATITSTIGGTVVANTHTW